MSPIIWLKIVMSSINKDELAVAYDYAVENGLTLNLLQYDAGQRYVLVPFVSTHLHMLVNLNQLRFFEIRQLMLLSLSHYDCA